MAGLKTPLERCLAGTLIKEFVKLKEDSFKEKYNIPIHFRVRLPTCDEEVLGFVDGEDTVAIRAAPLIHGGLTLPIQDFVGEFLHWQGIAPIQLVLNAYRVLTGVKTMSDQLGLEFQLKDLMGVYSFFPGKDGKGGSFRSPKNAHLVTGIPQTNVGYTEDVLIITGPWRPSHEDIKVPRVPTKERAEPAPLGLPEWRKIYAILTYWGSNGNDPEGRSAPTLLGYVVPGGCKPEKTSQVKWTEDDVQSLVKKRTALVKGRRSSKVVDEQPKKKRKSTKKKSSEVLSHPQLVDDDTAEGAEAEHSPRAPSGVEGLINVMPISSIPDADFVEAEGQSGRGVPKRISIFEGGLDGLLESVVPKDVVIRVPSPGHPLRGLIRQERESSVDGSESSNESSSDSGSSADKMGEMGESSNWSLAENTEELNKSEEDRVILRGRVVSAKEKCVDLEGKLKDSDKQGNLVKDDLRTEQSLIERARKVLEFEKRVGSEEGEKFNDQLEEFALSAMVKANSAAYNAHLKALTGAQVPYKHAVWNTLEYPYPEVAPCFRADWSKAQPVEIRPLRPTRP